MDAVDAYPIATATGSGSDGRGRLVMRGLSFFAIVLAIQAGVVDPALGQAPARVDLEKAVEREIAAGQAHEYAVELEASAYFHAAVEQLGIDVAVSILDPSGQPLTEVDSLTGAESSESVSIVATAPGSYRFVVHVGEGSDPPSGRYVVKAEHPRPATDRDRDRVAAEYASHRGLQLWLEENDEGRRAALAKYTESLASYRKAEDTAGAAVTLSTIGAITNELGQLDQAVAIWRDELPLRRAIGDRAGEVVVLNNLGTVCQQKGDFRGARLYFEQSLALAKALADKELEGKTLWRLGIVAGQLGEKRRSLDLQSSALPVLREHADAIDVARALTGMGSIHYDLGDRARALECFTSALPIWRSVGEQRAGEAGVLQSLGSLYADAGQLERARRTLEQALTISREVDDRLGQARTQNAIGFVAYRFGDRSEALSRYVKALALARDVGDRIEEARALTNIGSLYATARTSQDDRRARTHLLQSAAIWRQLNDPFNEASPLYWLGRISIRQDRYREGLGYLTRALQLSRARSNLPGETTTSMLLGDAYASRGLWRDAFSRYDAALAASRDLGHPTRQANVLIRMARGERARGRLDAARTRIEAALAIIESERAKIQSADLRSSYLVGLYELYDLYIDILMELHRREPAAGHDAEALRVSERARARSLVELLADSGADVRRGLDPALATRLADLRELLDAKALAHVRALTGGDAEIARSIGGEVDALLETYRSTLAEAQAASPRYADLTAPPALGLAEIRRDVLDPETAMVEYWLGNERSYAWVVTATSLRSYRLPGRARVDAAARALHGVLSSPSTARARGLELSASPEVEDVRRANAARLEREYLAAAGALSRMVLEPVVHDLTARRLLVVADGALHFIPFGALPLPAGGPRATPLLVDREVVYAPSASAIAVLRREAAGRAPAPKLLALFADPVFDAADERVGGRGAPAGADRDLVLGEAMQAAKDTSATGEVHPFPRLSFTRHEAEAIAALAPAGDRRVALDFGASRAAALADEIGQYRIVHFATHGYLNAVHPELSGLLLSLYDERGAPLPGFLATHDVFNMNLGADLVVLSACQTGLGREVRGEGLVGLTRAFMYAGSPRVVVSLWSVSDRATAELMARTYREMLGSGRPPAAALRAAQLEMWRQARWRAPYYWAPFVLQGEWR
jgi:CHAT domain-containing protein/tetratricopeptide (TPR) repeat protein